MKRPFGISIIAILALTSIALAGCGPSEEKKDDSSKSAAPQKPNPNKPSGMKAPGIKDNDG